MGDRAKTGQLFDNLDSEWISINQAAQYLGITPNALRIKVCRGEVQAHKLGGRLKFRISDLRGALTPRRR